MCCRHARFGHQTCTTEQRRPALDDKPIWLHTSAPCRTSKTARQHFCCLLEVPTFCAAVHLFLSCKVPNCSLALYLCSVLLYTLRSVVLIAVQVHMQGSGQVNIHAALLATATITPSSFTLCELPFLKPRPYCSGVSCQQTSTSDAVFLCSVGSSTLQGLIGFVNKDAEPDWLGR